MKKLPLDNSGRTWECLSCDSIFFIPEIILNTQKKEVGCPICLKQNWKQVPFVFLIIGGCDPQRNENAIEPKNKGIFVQYDQTPIQLKMEVQR